jgi:hypothetical protein
MAAKTILCRSLLLLLLSCNKWIILAAVGGTLRCMFLLLNMNPLLISTIKSTATIAMLEKHSQLRYDGLSTAAINNNESLWNIPITLQHPQPIQEQALPVSSVHCIGENFLNDTSPLFRSCQYTNLCFHSRYNEFVIYPSQQHLRLRSILHKDIHLSSVVQPVLAAAVPHPPRPRQTLVREILKDANSPESKAVWQQALFSPKEISSEKEPLQFTFRNDSVWVPFYPWWSNCAIQDVLVVWDVLLPVYTLLELFDLTNHTSVKLVLLPGDKNEICIPFLSKFANWLGLEMVTPGRLVQPFNRDVVICNHHSVAGLGAHAEHVTVLDRRQAKRPANIGRGSQLRNFRKHIHTKLNFRAATPHELGSVNATQPVLRVVISDQLSHHLQHVQQTKSVGLEIQVMPSHLDVEEQIAVVQYAQVLILRHSQDKTCALFLPDHATLIFVNSRQAHQTRQATSLDWELWNNYPMLKTHLIAGNNLTAQQEAINYIIEEEHSRLTESLSSRVRMLTKPEKSEAVQLDGGQSVTLIKQPPPTTRVHCTGESRDHDELGYRYRSCHFENLCFDLKRHDFVIFPSNATQSLEQFPKDQFYFSTVAQPMVSSGYVLTTTKAKPDMPRVVRKTIAASYYYLDATWLSYQTFSTCNEGHIFWDNFLPIHAMMEIFTGSLAGDIFASRLPCRRGDCPDIYNQMEVPFFGLNHSVRPLESQNLSIREAKSRYICARQGASGYGALNDHFINQHGWKREDLEYPHNVGRGPLLRRLRARLLQGLNLPSNTHVSEIPIVVTFSIHSSTNRNRRLSFSEEIERAKSEFSHITVESVQLWQSKLYEQVSLASRSTIYISAVGGGTFPAFFLPKGATLILYCDENMYLDFDLFNNYGQIRVHWLSLKSRQNDTNILIELLRDELCRLGNDDFTQTFNYTKLRCPSRH